MLVPEKISLSYISRYEKNSWGKVQRRREGWEQQRAQGAGGGGVRVVTSVRGACVHSAHTWKRFIQKLLQASQGFGFWWGGGGGEGCRVGGWEGDLTFSGLWKRMCYSWETKDFIVSMLEFSEQTWRWSQGMMGSKNMDDISNFDLFHMSITKPAFWNWLPCLFYKLILILISYLMAVEKKSPSCLNSYLWGLLLIKDQPAYHMKVFPTLIDLASDFLLRIFQAVE